MLGFSELNEQLKRDHQQRILECKLEKLQALKREVFFEKENEKKTSQVLLSKNRHILKTSDNMNSTLGSTTRLADSSAAADRFNRSNPKIYFKINRLAKLIQPIRSLQRAIAQQDLSGAIKTTRHLTTRDNVDLIEVEMNRPGESPPQASKQTAAARVRVGRHIATGIASFGDSVSRSVLKPASPYKFSPEDRPADGSADLENSALPKYILMMNKTVTEGYVPQHARTAYRTPSKPRLRPNIYGGHLHVGSSDNVKYLRSLPFPVQVFEDSS